MLVLGDGALPTLVACVADGAGSAKHSQIGSSLACNTILERASKHFAERGGMVDVGLDEILQWCDDARERIQDAAVQNDCRPRDLATTLCEIGRASCRERV